ncbi:angiotensin-converting enzyme-like isoform X2 [Vespa velutina]|uniref:angiotensin-converting enzyme-like isoform X2 n=1 Tax=Vespa velutina TaxID=202808 RepID=UPI001FB30C13|nr:angiotensin-converting enzyme-like isoform X2 [Vespa velutina]
MTPITIANRLSNETCSHGLFLIENSSYFFFLFIFLFIYFFSFFLSFKGLNVDLGEALQFLREYEREASSMCTRVMTAQWNFGTNVTESTKRKMLDEQTLKLKFERASWRKAVSFAWSRIPDPLARRELKMIVIRGRNALTDDKFNEIHKLIIEMKDIYSRTRLCPYRNMGSNCNLSIDHDISKIMAQSKDYDELLYYWHAWHEAIGPPLKNNFMRYVQLSNQASRLNGFADTGDQMREFFEDEHLEQNMAEVIYAIMPLYKNLFTYVRRKLYERYGDRIRKDGPLPAHILGNMWSQNWEGIYDLVQPFPASTKLDVTLDMMIQGYTPLRMFQIAEEFFTSLGMKPMPPEFWRFSMFEKPIDREVMCTAGAWDFCNTIDYRIKQCTKVTMEDLLSTHHEMAHLQYYLQYKDQPIIFRKEAIPGFHEAVSDAIVLSVMTPQHLHKINLHNNSTDGYESNINFLMLMALRKLAYIPFAYTIDQWRWRIFNEGIEDMTTKWWELRLQYQGIVPPVARTERDFDPAAKYHILADIPYAQYFVGTILQFQLFQSLCEISGHTSELHTCDLYRSRDAGRLLSDVLSIGASRHWHDVVRQMTRGKSNRLDADAIIKYFQPLYEWLKRQNEMEPVIGWITIQEDTALFAHWHQNQANYFTAISSIFFILVVASNIFFF